MSLRPPRSTRLYTLRKNRIVGAVDALCATVDRHWPTLAAAAILVIWGHVQNADLNQQLADLTAQRDEAQVYAAGRKVRVTIEGDPDQAANVALQVAAAVRP